MKFILGLTALIGACVANAEVCTMDGKPVFFDEETEIVSSPSELAGGRLYLFFNANGYVKMPSGEKVPVLETDGPCSKPEA